MEQHQEDQHHRQAAGGATAGQRGGERAQEVGRLRRAAAQVPRGVPQDPALHVLVRGALPTPG